MMKNLQLLTSASTLPGIFLGTYNNVMAPVGESKPMDFGLILTLVK